MAAASFVILLLPIEWAALFFLEDLSDYSTFMKIMYYGAIGLMHLVPMQEIQYRAEHLVKNQYHGPEEYLILFFMDLFVITLQTTMIPALIRMPKGDVSNGITLTSDLQI